MKTKDFLVRLYWYLVKLKEYSLGRKDINMNITKQRYKLLFHTHQKTEYNLNEQITIRSSSEQKLKIWSSLLFLVCEWLCITSISSFSTEFLCSY